MSSMTTSPATAHGRHPFTTAVAGKAGRPGSDTATVPEVSHSPARQGLTFAALVAVEARLAGALRRGEVGVDDPADADTAATLGLAAGRTNEHALRVARGDIEAIEYAVLRCDLSRSRPEPGDRLHVPAAGR